MCSAYEIERRPRGASRSACLGIFIALEIERRPRGASRASPLLHLLQRAMACEAIVACLVGMTQFFGWRCRRPICLQPCAKADNHGLTGTARCNKCRSGLARDAPRGRRSICASPQKPSQAPGSPNPISRQTYRNPARQHSVKNLFNAHQAPYQPAQPPASSPLQPSPHSGTTPTHYQQPLVQTPRYWPPVLPD